ncbi:MAG: phytanoyl-CoA dioxygenase family protein [Chitinophagales bacterium]
MWKRLVERIWPRQRSRIQRKFDPPLIRDEAARAQFEQRGWTLLPQVLAPACIQQLQELYQEIMMHPGYEHHPEYRNSMEFMDLRFKERIRLRTGEILPPFLEEFIDIDQAQFPFEGAFCIAPPRAKRGSPPHQDPNLVDETSTYGATIWIPLQPVSAENGCLHFLNGSHLWGNHLRSVSIRWAFEDIKNKLWPLMQPVPAQPGDVIIFDMATIHGSSTNKSDHHRIAINMVMLPKLLPITTSYQDKNGAIQTFSVTTEQLLHHNHFERPSPVAIHLSSAPPTPSYSIREVLGLIKQNTLKP